MAEGSVAPGAGDDEVLEWVRAAARGADDKGGQDTLILDVGPVLAITSYFVISSGRTSRQVKAMTEAVEEFVDHIGGPKPRAIEGLDSLEWVLMAYGDFVVHVFRQDTREHYELERLWRDVPVIDGS